MKTQLPTLLLFLFVPALWRTPARRRRTLPPTTKKPACTDWLSSTSGSTSLTSPLFSFAPARLHSRIPPQVVYSNSK